MYGDFCVYYIVESSMLQAALGDIYAGEVLYIIGLQVLRKPADSKTPECL